MTSASERRVLTYGIFDGFSQIHVQHLRHLAGLGDRLIVGVATDAFLARRGLNAIQSFEERAEITAACRYVDRVIPQQHGDQTRIDVVNYNIGLLAVDPDITPLAEDLDLLTEVLHLPRLSTPAPLFATSVA